MTAAHQMTGTPIRVENLWKRFGGFEAVKDVTFTAEAGTPYHLCIRIDRKSVG